MRLPEIWDEWAVYDDNGISGLRDDAPEDVKKAYEDHLKELERLKKEHKKH